MDFDNPKMSLQEAIAVIREIDPSAEETNSRRAETIILQVIHDGAQVVQSVVVTNADRIRTMSDEELAEWVKLIVCKYRSCGNCPMSDWCTTGRGIEEWLKSPVEVDNES